LRRESGRFSELRDCEWFFMPLLGTRRQLAANANRTRDNPDTLNELEAGG